MGLVGGRWIGEEVIATEHDEVDGRCVVTSNGRRTLVNALGGYGVSWRWPGSGDPSVTYGKNGIPPLPAQPEVIPESRRCRGAPGCEGGCDAVLGPVAEWPDDLCAHCRNLANVLAEQTDETEEAFTDCDRCAPDRTPKAGKLCGRCLAEEGRTKKRVIQACRTAALTARGSVKTLVAVEYFSAGEGEGVRSAIDVVLMVMGAELGVMSPRQEVAAACLLLDAVTSVLDIRRELARDALGQEVGS